MGMESTGTGSRPWTGSRTDSGISIGENAMTVSGSRLDIFDKNWNVVGESGIRGSESMGERVASVQLSEWRQAIRFILFHYFPFFLLDCFIYFISIVSIPVLLYSLSPSIESPHSYSVPRFPSLLFSSLLFCSLLFASLLFSSLLSSPLFSSPHLLSSHPLLSSLLLSGTSVLTVRAFEGVLTPTMRVLAHRSKIRDDNRNISNYEKNVLRRDGTYTCIFDCIG